VKPADAAAKELGAFLAYDVDLQAAAGNDGMSVNAPVSSRE